MAALLGSFPVLVSELGRMLNQVVASGRILVAFPRRLAGQTQPYEVTVKP